MNGYNLRQQTEPPSLYKQRNLEKEISFRKEGIELILL
jgi:hypothetical protein